MSTHPEPSATARLLAVRAPLQAGLSPDASSLVLTTVVVAAGTLTELVQVSVIDLATGDETPLAGAKPGDHSATWSPDGSRLAWCSTAPDTGDDDNGDDVAVVVVADRAGGAAQVVAASRGVNGSVAWSPDGGSLVFGARRGELLDRTLPYRWDRPIPAFDGLGELEDPPQIHLVDLASGAGRWLTDDAWRWSSPRWSPAGDRVAATMSLDPTGQIGGQFLRIIHLDGRIEAPAVPGGRSVLATWLPDGRLAVLVAEPHGGPFGSAAVLYLVDGIDGSDGSSDGVRRVDLPESCDPLFGDVYGDQPGELADSYDGVLLSEASGHLIVRVGAHGRMGIVRLHPDRPDDVTVLVDGQRCCTPVGCANGTMVFTTLSIDAPAELVVLDVAAVDAGAPANERLLTRFGDGFDPTVTTQRFTAVSPDGWTIDAWFVSPRTAGATPLPTIALIHGGPHFAYGEGFSFDVHALCDAGFGVLYANLRGSTGYGDAFAHAVHSDWAEGPSSDLLAVIDRAIELGYADPERLGVTGNSYGGYLAAWLASTTTRFRAAVIENPVTDLVSMYGTSDIGATYFPGQFGGAPHERLDVYTGQSPILQGHRCRTPSLFVVGEHDRRCPPAQAWAMHRVIRATGTPSEVLTLPGSSHEGSTYGPPTGRLAHDQALVEWMLRWL